MILPDNCIYFYARIQPTNDAFSRSNHTITDQGKNTTKPYSYPDISLHVYQWVSAIGGGRAGMQKQYSYPDISLCAVEHR